MQKKHTKGLFIDSSCRRSALLKTLLHGLRTEQRDGEEESAPYQGEDSPLTSSDQRGPSTENDKIHMKIAASL